MPAFYFVTVSQFINCSVADLESVHVFAVDNFVFSTHELNSTKIMKNAGTLFLTSRVSSNIGKWRLFEIVKPETVTYKFLA